jgi:hypothetical protein
MEVKKKMGTKGREIVEPDWKIYKGGVNNDR